MLFHSEVQGISTVDGQKSRDKAPEQPCRVVNHGNDAGVIEPCRADDPKHANDSLREIMQMISDGKLHPDVSAQFPLAEGGKAIRMLQDRKAMGKVVVTM